MRLSVIIVTWNSQRFINDCLESVFSQQIDDMEIIVIDNGSSDNTLQILEGFTNRIILIKNQTNTGFCLANNQAILKAQGKYIFTLNSDVILGKGYLKSLIGCLETNKQIGMVQGKLLRFDRKTIDGLGLRLSLLMRLYNIQENKADSNKFDKPREIFGPCAAAAVYKKELLAQIRYQDEFFDEKFFFLVEDFDLAWRARIRGWKAMYVPDAIAYHYRESSAYINKFKQYLSFRNRYFMLIKNADWRHVFMLISGLFIYELPRFIYMLLFNKNTIKALKEIHDYLPELRKKRYKPDGFS
ncbi:MAG: glycosyltransferase family 2 protein [Candidatus Omnitrophica bacterium]|nr:glycosyltransferase family 2 protein [Candidatus Omnitrophota bacterium]